MDSVPKEAEPLLSAAPDEFVQERQRLVRALRDDGRRRDADAVAALRKPPPVVLAANRAARDAPKAARAAAKAAERVAKTQLGSNASAYRAALGDLDEALDTLATAALANLSPGGKPPSEAVSRRLRDLLRNAVADEQARDELARGVLRDETETAGFGAFASVAPSPRRGTGTATKTVAQRERDAEKERRERERRLRDELARAEDALADARNRERQADRDRKAAERVVDSLRAWLDRLRSDAES